MKSFLLTFIILLNPIYSPHSRQLSTQNAKKFLNQLSILRPSLISGNVIAIKNMSKEKLLGCSQGICIKLENTWQLFGTKIVEEQFHPIFLYSPNAGWTFIEFPIERSLFSLKSPAILRLPAQVKARLENKDELIAEEAKYNRKIYQSSQGNRWPCQWQDPINAKSVSSFASTRTLPNGVTYPHTGLDLRAKLATPIYAVSDGTILSTDHQTVGGNIINIDHGKGLISRYLHLSEFKVKPGDQVKAGEVIAMSGASGRVEAPHLHWEMRVRGIAVDPQATLQMMPQICDLK